MITYVKMVSGTELIGRVEEETEGCIKLYRPMDVSIISREDNNSYFQLVPHSYISDIIEVTKRYVLERAEVTDQLEKMYLKLVDSSSSEVDEEQENDEETQSAPPPSPKRILH